MISTLPVTYHVLGLLAMSTGNNEEIARLLLNPPNTLHIGKTLDVPDVFERYVLPEKIRNKRKRTTMRDLARHIAVFESWWAAVTNDTSLEGEKLTLNLIDRRHLEEFRGWLIKYGLGACNINRHVASVKQVLRAAKRHGLILSAPELEGLQHRSVAAKVYLEDEQVNRLWDAAAYLTWPRFDSLHRPLPYSPPDAWRYAMVLYRVYGFRTQELIRHEEKYRPLRWRDIYDQDLTPNPSGQCRNKYGWFSYVPPKQERFKPEPLVDPLTWYTRAAIWAVRPEHPDPDRPVLDWILSSTSFRATWHKWFRIADIQPRKGSGVAVYTPCHWRNTATTKANQYIPGVGEHIVGHAFDRTGQVSLISAKHYNHAELAVQECLAGMKYPECFDRLDRSCLTEAKRIA